MFWITAILGVAFGIAPWFLGYADHVAAMRTSVLFGLLVFTASVYGLLGSPVRQGWERWEYWVLALAAPGMAAAPLVFGYSSHAQPAWTALLLAATLVLLNSLQILRTPQRQETNH